MVPVWYKGYIAVLCGVFVESATLWDRVRQSLTEWSLLYFDFALLSKQHPVDKREVGGCIVLQLKQTQKVRWQRTQSS